VRGRTIDGMTRKLKKKNFLTRLAEVESQETKKILLLSVLIICLCTFVFYKSQKILPLFRDQITNATIVEHFQNPHLYDHDPLWGKEKLFLPLNLGVLSFYGLSRLGSIEVGIPIAQTLVIFSYLIISFIFFYKCSRSTALALSLSLLSCFFAKPTSTDFWGFGFSTTFLSRTIFLPFVPLIFYSFLDILKNPTAKKCMLFYFFLGILAFVHQVSSFYLFLSFILSFFYFHPRLVKIHILSIIFWFLAVSPLIIYAIHHYNFTNHVPIPSATSLQMWIEGVFQWAFPPAVGKTALTYILKNPHHIAMLLFIPFIFRKNMPVKYFTVTMILIIISGLGVYGIQFFLLKTFEIPFKFVDVLRGFRFIPFLAFMLLAAAWQDILAYFRRVLSTRHAKYLISLIPFFLLIVSISIFIFRYHSGSPRFSGYTCSDPIFEALQQLPPTALIATDLGVLHQSQSTEFLTSETIPELRCCGKRAVYAKHDDGSLAYYNGRDEFVRWILRVYDTWNFFVTLNKESLSVLKRDGVTHLCVKGELPSSKLWIKVYCSSQYCLYKVKEE
jgi:hypothetical protein